MDKCWASTIGGCSNKLSGEHYISKGLWLGRTLITISGVYEVIEDEGLVIIAGVIHAARHDRVWRNRV